MPIDKVKLFEATKALWPTEINLDGMVINGKYVKGGQILVELYDMFEESFDVNDHWKQLAIWAFHQALPRHYRQQNGDECSTVIPREVTFEDFDQKMRENLLGDDCWKPEREIYFKTDRTNKNEEE